LKKIFIIISLGLLFSFQEVAGSGIDKGFSTHATLEAFLSTGSYSAESIKAFDDFLSKLEKKHASTAQEKVFINYIFSKTHQRFLKNFSALATLNGTFDNGSYNCLTGTVLYSLILHHFNIEHRVIETNYHIFILVETQQGQVLLEATDPINGFIDSRKEIETRINSYKQNELQAQASDNTYKFRFDLFNTVSLNELRGLLYYNMAVSAFNKKDFKQSVEQIIKADELYRSSRIEEFSQILLLSVRQSNLEEGVKENYMNRIIAMRQETLPLVASLK
jgi:hypothetical protein